MEQIQLFNKFNDDGSCNTTLLFDSARALASFRTLLTLPLPQDGEPIGPQILVDGVPLNYLYEIVIIIHKQMNEESVGFTNKVHKRATDIVYTRLLS